jgi:hypothetical protein
VDEESRRFSVQKRFAVPNAVPPTALTERFGPAPIATVLVNTGVAGVDTFRRTILSESPGVPGRDETTSVAPSISIERGMKLESVVQLDPETCAGGSDETVRSPTST